MVIAIASGELESNVRTLQRAFELIAEANVLLYPIKNRCDLAQVIPAGQVARDLRCQGPYAGMAGALIALRENAHLVDRSRDAGIAIRDRDASALDVRYLSEKVFGHWDLKYR